MVAMPPMRLAAPLLAGVLFARLLSALNSQLYVREYCPIDEPPCAVALEAHLQNHTIVHVGGQHRGGTTLLWRGMSAHPLVASHAPVAAAEDEHAPQHLHGEGIFLQSVYAKLSLDHPPLFFMRKRALAVGCAALRLVISNEEWLRSTCRLAEGVGSYALSSAARDMQQLGARHPLATREPARQLFSQWAYHWDLTRPVLLEKSPSNALTGPLLNAMWVAAGLSRSPRFIFISRHPIVQSMGKRTLNRTRYEMVLVRHRALRATVLVKSCCPDVCVPQR